MGSTGTKSLIIMLTINIFLVLGGFTIVDVDLMGMFQDPSKFIAEILKLGIGIAGAPLALLANAGIPAEIRLVFGLPLTAAYTLAWIQFIRGKPL